jgi:hypothetical protein
VGWLRVAGLSLLLAASGCAKTGSPEQVADSFVDAYFRRADQERAKDFTALGATQMLEQELAAVAALRKEGYGPEQANVDISVHRGATTSREQRVRIPYEIVVHEQSGDAVRDADIELTQIQGAWKVVRVGLSHR